MAWDEWEQLKAHAAERNSAHMNLNGLTRAGGHAKQSDGAGGNGTLKHKGGPWTTAAGTSEDLQTRTSTARDDLTSTHEGIGGGLAGLASLGSLKAVHKSWHDRLGRVRDECSSLEPKLRQVAVDLGEVDAEVSHKAEAVRVPGIRRGE
ncbi:hypothetical protein [Streptomyces sp. NRRL S-340]|uniref:hypothetical protein n=1 Tax=Streptomyces sp. NRRL S-340 TaxID=1463901 RepID=UPI00055A0870|nr:hypothetical protein [Streptomyces sp. NRRL S-340]